MERIICGELVFNGNNYKFDFRDNILVIQPEKLEKYSEWYFKQIGKGNTVDMEEINLEGTTNNGYYICFVHIKFSHLGRGILKAYVPGYILCRANNINNIPSCNEIEKLRFYGECLDKFYYPKRVVENNDLLKENKLKIEIDNQNIENDEIKINNDIFSFGVEWKMPYSSNINVVLDVTSYLEIKFNSFKDLEQLIKYYINVKKIFSFLYNRRFIKFKVIKAYKKVQIYNPIEKNMNVSQIEYEVHFLDTDEEIDINKRNYIHLEEIKGKLPKIYKEITNQNFLTEYYPSNEKDSLFIDNNKFLQIASAFESEFDKLFPNFKSTNSSEYKDVKDSILKCLNNKRYKLKKIGEITEDIDKKKMLKKEIKECDYFSKIIRKIEGTLEEKIVYSFNKYEKIIEKAKEKMLKNYSLAKAKSGKLASDFVKRRNDISHGNGTMQFNAYEIISYELIRMCIYCITYERCGFNIEEIAELVYKSLI